jgi:ATP-dependent Lon protease
MSAEPLPLPAGFAGQVRLFPLNQVVLFPGNILPLHIFESRYREMLEDALVGDQLITMATLEPGFEADYYSRPPISPFVCIGQVTAHEKKDQGTYDLILVGLRRARIEHEVEPVRSFRRAQVTLIAEESEVALQPDGLGIGRQLVSRIRRLAPGTGKVAKEYERGNLTLGALTDLLGFHLPLDTDFKLALLAEGDVVKRARLLLKALPEDEPPPRRRYPQPFSDN